MGALLVADPVQFFGEFWPAGSHAIVIWALPAPIGIAAGYGIALPIVRGIDRVRRAPVRPMAE